MNSDYLKTAVKTMHDRGVEFAPGLAAREVGAAESEHGFRFPSDLRAFLENALPVGEGFPDWRSPVSQLIKDSLAWPADGMCFDVEHNAFWLPAWGPMPGSLEEAHAKARQAVRDAPFLIPIFGHRYLPASPCHSGNPVFSVYQTDIIYYGLDFPSYLSAEFGVPNPFPVPDLPREIEFWSEMERLNSQG
jgi:hypothetical protein